MKRILYIYPRSSKASRLYTLRCHTGPSKEFYPLISLAMLQSRCQYGPKLAGQQWARATHTHRLQQGSATRLHLGHVSPERQEHDQHKHLGTGARVAFEPGSTTSDLLKMVNTAFGTRSSFNLPSRFAKSASFIMARSNGSPAAKPKLFSMHIGRLVSSGMNSSDLSNMQERPSRRLRSPRLAKPFLPARKAIQMSTCAGPRRGWGAVEFSKACPKANSETLHIQVLLN